MLSQENKNMVLVLKYHLMTFCMQHLPGKQSRNKMCMNSTDVMGDGSPPPLQKSPGR